MLAKKYEPLKLQVKEKVEAKKAVKRKKHFPKKDLNLREKNFCIKAKKNSVMYTILELFQLKSVPQNRNQIWQEKMTKLKA